METSKYRLHPVITSKFLDGILQHYEELREEQAKTNAINAKRIADLEKRINRLYLAEAYSKAKKQGKCLMIKL